MNPRKNTPETADTLAAETVSEAELARRRAAAGSTPIGRAAERVAGRYEILSLLGAGGMGAVYKAHDLELDELIALKVLREELCADESAILRFRREVKLARKVTHPNVARTFDIGEHGVHKFLTMELIDGVSLFDATSSGPRLGLPDVIEIASRVCAGLGAAHAAGIVHRDLKPENVLLAGDGRVLITDFGIARAVSPESHLGGQTEGVPIGTPAYMAPEQVENLPDVDGRADLYALGAIVYELLTGVRAWDSDTLAVMAAKRLHEPPPDPRTIRPDVPENVARMIMRCMATEREARYPTAAALASALEAIVAAADAPAPSARPRTSAQKKSVAVLPFRNAGLPGDDYVADGLTDDLTDLLSMTPGLRVAAKGVVIASGRETGDPREIGEQLGVQVVVLGTVRRGGGRLRVTARVVSVTDGFQLWARTFDHEEGAFFELSETMAHEVASALTVELDAVPREPATHPVALDLYLKARYDYQKFWRESLLAACEMFEQALILAPDHPMILAGYALALLRRCAFDDATDQHMDRSRRAADRALEISPQLASARVARAYDRFMCGETVRAAEELREVLVSAPDSVDALELSGRVLIEAGAVDEGVRRLRRAMAVDPNLRTARIELARVEALHGDRAASEALFGEEPDHPGLSHVYWAHRSRVAVWHQDRVRAKRWCALLADRGNIFPGIITMMRIAAGETLPPETVEILLGAASEPSRLIRRRAFRGVLAAEYGGATGQLEIAMTGLLHAADSALFDIGWVDRCPVLRPLDHDPRFQAIRARVAARAEAICAALGVVTAAPYRAAS
jgi:serine/threonine-protein kinase